MSRRDPLRRSSRPFALLLWLFPKSFRASFGDDMRDTFVDQRDAARRQGGRLAVMRLWIWTAVRMTSAAWREWRTPAVSRPRSPRARPQPGRELVSDVRLALRGLRRQPVFTMMSIGAVAIGIGAVATIFSALNAMTLRPLAGTTDGARLVGIDRRSPDFSEGASASPAFLAHLRERSRQLAGAAGWSRVTLSIASGGTAVAADGNIVTADYFTVLGLRPALGRLLTPDDDRTPLGGAVVVVSHRFWTEQLGADPAIVGRTVMVNRRPYTLVGVAPRGFRGVFTPLEIDAWVPLAMQPHVHPGRSDANDPWLWMFGRLAPGVRETDARGELAALTAAWSAASSENAAIREYTNIRLTPLTGLPDDARRALLAFGAMLLGAATLVLLIACANVSSLLAARAMARQREMGLRTALGAGRLRLIRLLLTETAILFVAGGIGGVVIAQAATAALARIPLPGDSALSLDLSPDGRVVGAAIVTALAMAIVFGIGPAIAAARRNLVDVLRSSSSAATRRFRGTRTLIVLQLASSLVLVAGAGLFVRALDRGAAITPGFDAANVATASINTAAFGYTDAEGQRFYERLREALAATPGVTDVAFSSVVPFAATPNGTSITPIGATGAGARLTAHVVLADERYFDVLRIPIVAGRKFAREDGRGRQTAIVSATFAARAWSNEPAVGRALETSKGRYEVIGVAGDVRYSVLSREEPPVVYWPVGESWRPNQAMFVRTAGGAALSDRAFARVIRSIDPLVPRLALEPLADVAGVALLPQRVAAAVAAWLGGAALALASIGLHGLIAYSVTLRWREIGVRMALGARRGDVLAWIVADGLRLTAVSVALGLGAAVLVAPALAAYLVGLPPLDVTAFAGASALLVGVAALASYLPARRAAAVDPLTALRSD